MPQRSLGNFVFTGLVLINLILWGLFAPVDDGTFADYRGQVAGEVFSIISDYLNGVFSVSSYETALA